MHLFECNKINFTGYRNAFYSCFRHNMSCKFNHYSSVPNWYLIGIGASFPANQQYRTTSFITKNYPTSFFSQPRILPVNNKGFNVPFLSVIVSFTNKLATTLPNQQTAVLNISSQSPCATAFSGAKDHKLLLRQSPCSLVNSLCEDGNMIHADQPAQPPTTVGSGGGDIF